MNKKRVIIIVGVGILLLIAIIALCVVEFSVALFRTLENRLIVENRSDVSITHLTVRVSDGAVTSDVMTFNDVAPGQQVEASYNPRGESTRHFSFYIVGELADGTRLGGSFGRTFSGVFGERTYVTIMPDGDIEFEQNYDY